MKNIETHVSNNGKKDFAELEIKIFEKILLNHHQFSGALFLFAVLEKSEDSILLGSTKETVNKVDYNASLIIALREIVGTVLDNKYIEVKLKTAEKEFLSAKKRIDKKFAEQKDQEKFLAEIEEQKFEGKCNLIPFPAKENKVRSDLTIERHALFASNTFKGDFRTYERKIKNPHNSQDYILRIEIGDQTVKGLGVLKQKHQEAFYILSQVWEKQDYKLEEDKRYIFGSLEISVYDLVQKLRGDDAGKNYKKVLKLLQEMSSIRVNIKKYDIEEGTWDIQNFALLSYEWSVKSFSEKTLRPKSDGDSKVYIRFSDFVTNNFLRKNVKSLMLSPYLGLKDNGGKGVAQLLYTLLDYELATKDKFHISLINLSHRLGLTQYRYKSDRRRKLEDVMKSINGQIILDGKFKINAYFEESEDQKDWIFVARKTVS